MARMSLLLVVCLFTLGLPAQSPKEPPILNRLPPPLTFPPEKGDVLLLPASAVDGDTIRFYFLIEATGRIHGINAPESKGATKAAGLAAKAFLTHLLPKLPVAGTLHGKEKYGRYLISFTDGQGFDIAKLMIDAGHAKPYDGKGPLP
jgi:endonuclease YncB( thermonuclease family)